MTEKPLNVRPATTDDKQKIYDLLMFLYAENAPFKMNESKVREMIRRGADDKDVILAVVDAPDGTLKIARFPSLDTTLHATVGLSLESKIW